MQAATGGITRPAKVQYLADGGFVKAVKGIVEQLTTQTPKDAPLGSGAANQAKQALTTRKQVLDDAERKAVGMAKGGAVRYGMRSGGKIPGKSPTPTADNIPIDATAGEFMIKKKSADVLGPKVLRALNAVGDQHPDKSESSAVQWREGKRGHGAVRKMSGGGTVVVYDPNKAYKPNFTMGGGAPDYPDRLRVGVNPPGTAVVPAQYRPNFTMGANTITPPALDPVTDVRAKFNSANASPEAKAYMADRAMNPGPQPAGIKPSPGTTPSQTIFQRASQGVKDFSGLGGNAAGSTSKLGAATAKLGRGALRAAGRLALPVAAGSELVDVATVANDPNSSGLDVVEQAAQGVGRVGAATAGAGAGAALGSAIAPGPGTVIGGLVGGAAGYFGADKIIEAGRAALGMDPRAPVDQIPTVARTPAVVVTPAAAAAAYPENAARRSLASPAIPQAVANAVANPVNPAGAVTRIGNSYSGAPGISGDISVNGAAPRGGFVSGTGDGTFKYGGGSGGASDQALHEARLGAVRRGDIDAVRASYAAQGQDFGPKVDPIQALLNNGRPMTTRKAAALAALQKNASDQAAGEEQRRLERDKFGLEATGAKLDNEGKAQLGALRQVLVNPKATKDQKDAAASSVRALLGKNDLPPVREFAVPGGSLVDQQTGAVMTQPSLVYDPSTKQFISPPTQKGAQRAQIAEGSISEVNGKRAKYIGGKWVPQ